MAQGGVPRFELPAVPFDYSVPEVAFLYPAGNMPTAKPRKWPTSETLWGARQARLHAGRRDQRAALGRVLFYDRLLSRDRSRSCSSCHVQARGFADGRARSVGSTRASRSAMPIVNLAYNRAAWFWDGRVERLEQAVLQPIENPDELDLPLVELIERLGREPGYGELFRTAFGDDVVTEQRIGEALATFVRSITSFGSRYDEGLAAAKGDEGKDFPNFTAAENRGKALFFGRSDGRGESCAACHVHRGVGCGGVTLNFFPSVLQGNWLSNNGVDTGTAGDDPGYGAVSGKPQHAGLFRAPSLRNIAVTAPYMHDGRMATLKQVVDFYAAGVRPHANLDPLLTRARSGYRPRGTQTQPTAVSDSPTLVGPSPGIELSVRQRADLVAFLHTLTDEGLLTDPRFADPFVR